MTRQEAEGTLARDYPPSECPALTAQRNAWAQTRPLAGLTVLDATPLFRNTLVKHLALQAAGAEVWVGYGRAMPFDPMAAEMAPALGLNIPDAARLAQGFDVVVDCAAAFADIPARLGYAELTRSGVAGYCAVAKTKPVFNVDGSRIKTFETALTTWGEVTRTGPDTLRVALDGKAVDVRIAASAPWSLAEETLEGNPLGRRWKSLAPKRLAIRLDQPAAAGTVAIRVTAAKE